jgi:hypothetical protein
MTPTLQDLVARELARRAAADANRYAPEGLILEGGPGSDGRRYACQDTWPPSPSLASSSIRAGGRTSWRGRRSSWRRAVVTTLLSVPGRGLQR